MAYTAKDPCPPTAFSVPRINKSWRCEEEEEEEGEEEKVNLLTQSTTRGMGNNVIHI